MGAEGEAYEGHERGGWMGMDGNGGRQETEGMGNTTEKG